MNCFSHFSRGDVSDFIASFDVAQIYSDNDGRSFNSVILNYRNTFLRTRINALPEHNRRERASRWNLL